MYKEFPPFFRREKRPCRNIPVASLVVASGIEDHGSVEAFLLHCLKVGGDCLAGHVAIQPPPPAVGAIFGRRLSEVVLQIRRGIILVRDGL